MSSGRRKDAANGSQKRPPKFGTINCRPKGWKNYVEEVLARATSVKDSIDRLKGGTVLYKLRDKGVRGLKIYRRKYRLNIADLIISYLPNKGLQKNSCVGGSGSIFIDLAEIAEVRSGHGTDAFNLISKPGFCGTSNGNVSSKDPHLEGINLCKNHSFSLIFKDARQPLDLVAENQQDRDNWVEALTHLVVTIRSLGQQKEYEIFLKKQFQNADKNKNGTLTLEECKNLVEQLNIKMDKESLRELFNRANKNPAKGNGRQESLDESEFVSFYYSLLKRPELDEVFIRYAKANMAKDGSSLKEVARMTPDDLMEFMKKEQKVEMDLEECKKIIEAFEPTQDRSALSMEGFTHFMMFSDWQEVTDVTHRKIVYQDMHQPLTHYWIASSHNTYLLGNQVTGESSVDAYVNALKKGCRCVELDCWDGDDGEPIIYHGWTLTSKILFKEVMQDAIAQYAFHSSEYPLILSIENHCSIEQQDKMADHMKTYLGSMLYTEPVDETRDSIPSPEDLKRKILVKAKKLPPGATQDDENLDDDDDDDDERDEKKKNSSKKISEKLSNLVNYIQAVHFHSFEDSRVNGKCYQMSSFGESKAKSFFEDPENSVEFVRYNMKQISRIYPSGKRQDSSNLSVIPGWNSGCQIVALNYQTEDAENFLNSARFGDNGGCGYILKPEFMRNPAIRYSPVSPARLNPKLFPAWKVEMVIVSGQHIPRPDGKLEGEVIDPYVKVKIRGHPDDDEDGRTEDDRAAKRKPRKNKAKTDAVSNNGFNPVWKERFHFDVRVPTLAFIEFKVKDYSKSGRDNLLGAFCAPLTMIQEGYRRVPLHDYSGKDLSPASLLIHIEIKEID